MDKFRESFPAQAAGSPIVAVEDYLKGVHMDLTGSSHRKISLPSSNVLKYYLQDGSWFCIRPSGTEPKAKFYFGVKGTSLPNSAERLARLEEDVMRWVENELNQITVY